MHNYRSKAYSNPHLHQLAPPRVKNTQPGPKVNFKGLTLKLIPLLTKKFFTSSPNHLFDLNRYCLLIDALLQGCSVIIWSSLKVHELGKLKDIKIVKVIMLWKLFPNVIFKVIRTSHMPTCCEIFDH